MNLLVAKHVNYDYNYEVDIADMINAVKVTLFTVMTRKELNLKNKERIGEYHGMFHCFVGVCFWPPSSDHQDNKDFSIIKETSSHIFLTGKEN